MQSLTKLNNRRHTFNLFFNNNETDLSVSAIRPQIGGKFHHWSWSCRTRAGYQELFSRFTQRQADHRWQSLRGIMSPKAWTDHQSIRYILLSASNKYYSAQGVNWKESDFKNMYLRKSAAVHISVPCLLYPLSFRVGNVPPKIINFLSNWFFARD